MERTQRMREERGENASSRLLPEVVFRELWPSEAMIAVVREQDALYRGIVHVDAAPSRVVIQRRGQGATSELEVHVTSAARGEVVRGCAKHVSFEWAIRNAYTELLRQTVDERARGLSRCAHAA